MLNYSLLFLHPHEKHFREEEILSQKYYYTSFIISNWMITDGPVVTYFNHFQILGVPVRMIIF
jgi:hypothetical protein